VTFIGHLFKRWPERLPLIKRAADHNATLAKARAAFPELPADEAIEAWHESGAHQPLLSKAELDYIEAACDVAVNAVVDAVIDAIKAQAAPTWSAFCAKHGAEYQSFVAEHPEVEEGRTAHGAGPLRRWIGWRDELRRSYRVSGDFSGCTIGRFLFRGAMKTPVIYTMGKVGSSSISSAIKNAGLRPTISIRSMTAR
jgi:hypothetical protein